MMQDWFQEAKLGIFIHWGIYAVNPTGESWPFFRGEISHEDYMAQREGFTASNYDPQEWAQLFKDAGAQYAVLTSKHHDGMALYPTKEDHWNVVRDTPAGRDLIGPYCEALREKGLHVGLYFSHLDWSHPDYPTLPKDIPPSDHGDASKVNDFVFREDNPEAWKKFLTFHRAQLKEICTSYSPELLWFDGDWDRTSEQWDMKGLRDQLHEWSPGVVINSRMKGYGDYSTPEQGVPTVAPEGEWEFCMTLNDNWGYLEPEDMNYKSARQVIRYFVDCLSMGGKLLLDIGPAADGSIPATQQERLRELGDWVKKHNDAILGTGAGLPLGHIHAPTTLSTQGNSLFIYLFDQPRDQIAIKGLRNTIKSISLVGDNTALSHQRIGGAAWHNIPGVLWIDIPQTGLDERCAVVRVDFEGELDLYSESGGNIEQN